MISLDQSEKEAQRGSVDRELRGSGTSATPRRRSDDDDNDDDNDDDDAVLRHQQQGGGQTTLLQGWAGPLQPLQVSHDILMIIMMMQVCKHL